MAKSPNRYGALIEKIFFDRYSDGAIPAPKNLE